MTAVNMLEAKTHLFRLVEAIEQGKEREIIIARNGRPVARLAPLEEGPAELRIGIARGEFEVPDDIDISNEEVARLFLGNGK